jgi:hypothetical protein
MIFFISIFSSLPVHLSFSSDPLITLELSWQPNPNLQSKAKANPDPNLQKQKQKKERI